MSTMRRGLSLVATALLAVGVGVGVAGGSDVRIQYANSDCATLTSPGGARAEVCKTWHTESDGAGWFGAVTGRVFGATFVQVRVTREDGSVYVTHLADRPDGIMFYFGAKEVRTHACNSISDDCGPWW